MTRGDADAEKHKLWCLGKLGPGERSPLLSKDELGAEVGKMMEAWRDHNSEGSDMGGLSPRAVFVQCAPASGFRRITEDELAFATGEHFENKHIDIGGIIELRDGSRYYHPLLTGLGGQTREVVRLRHDHSFVTILPAQKGEGVIIARRKVRVGMHDRDNLAREMEVLNRVKKIVGATVRPLEYEPGAEFPHAQPKPEPPPIPPGREIGSPEFLMEHDRYKKTVEAWDFADLEG
jgi:hypothetical protein